MLETAESTFLGLAAKMQGDDVDMESSGVLGWRRSARCLLFVGLLVILNNCWNGFCETLTLAWNQSNDPTVAGYHLYCGAVSRNYTNWIDTGSATSVTISNLPAGITCYFAATTYSIAGLESDFSTETSYTTAPPDQPPTLDPIRDMTINEGAGSQTITLTGITSGISSQTQSITISAISSDPGLVANPAVNYTSPNTQGTLTFTVAPESFGSAVLTVFVDNGASTSNTTMRSFNVIVLPVNHPPTLDPIADVVLNENSSTQTISLSGIGAGSINETQTLTLSASSSNPNLIPTPVVAYASPNPAATLSLTPLTNTFGSATITVTISDGQPTNSTTTRSFTVTVNPTAPAQSLLTNAMVLPNSLFRFVLNPPFTNGDRFSYSLAADAPAGASILTKKGVSSVVWIPTSSQASTTNLFTIQVTDRTTPAASTNESIQVIVLDYLAIGGGSTTVQAGQNATLPIFLSSSEGVTNVTFIVEWPSSRFLNPVLSVLGPAGSSGSVQNQSSNLLINLQNLTGPATVGSNLIAQLSFQAIANQASAFINLPVKILKAIKPDSTAYNYEASSAEQIVVVNDTPLLQGAGTTNSSRRLTLFGRIGTNYQLQYSTNLLSASWSQLFNYTQTNLAQTVNVAGTAPLIFYRIVQQ